MIDKFHLKLNFFFICTKKLISLSLSLTLSPSHTLSLSISPLLFFPLLSLTTFFRHPSSPFSALSLFPRSLPLLHASDGKNFSSSFSSSPTEPLPHLSRVHKRESFPLPHLSSSFLSFTPLSLFVSRVGDKKFLAHTKTSSPFFSLSCPALISLLHYPLFSSPPFSLFLHLSYEREILYYLN